MDLGPAKWAALLLVPLTCVTPVSLRGEAQTLAPLLIEGDRISEPLGRLTGDATRGRVVLMSRETGNCLICHRLTASGERFQGEIGPALDDVGARLDPGQIRLRLVDQSRINPETLMPPYHRIDGLTRVGDGYDGKPALSAQQIEDLVAYLSTLR